MKLTDQITQWKTYIGLKAYIAGGFFFKCKSVILINQFDSNINLVSMNL